MAKIIGLGEWFPSSIRNNDAWPTEIVNEWLAHGARELVDVVDKMPFPTDPYTIQGFSEEASDPFMGSVSRRIADESMTSLEAETLAAKMAIEKSGIDPADIKYIFNWALTPDIVNFTTAAAMAMDLGATKASTFGLDGACASSIGQLIVAQALVDSGEAEYVLLTQSHLATRVFPFSHPASPTLGDCATAMIVGGDHLKGHEILATHSCSHGEFLKSVCWRRKDGDQSWFKSGGDYYLGSFDREQARALIQTTVSMGAKTTEEALKKISLTPTDLDFFVSVNPRKWIPAGMAQVMGLPASKTLNTFEKYAHLGGCGSMANLIEAEKLGHLKENNIVGMYSQGMGFTRGAIILKW